MINKPVLPAKLPAEIIVMLTCNDVTARNARDVFLSACDLDINN
jgi:hypothetical protein